MLLIRAYSFNWCLILFYLSTSCEWLWLLLLQLRSFKALYIIHWLVLNFIALNWTIITYDISHWTSTSLTETTASSDIFWIFNHKLRVLDSRILDHVCINYTDQNQQVESWFIFSHANASSINLFMLELTHVGIKNWYLLAQTYTCTSVSFELPFTAYLSLIYSVLVITYLLLRGKNNLIM